MAAYYARAYATLIYLLPLRHFFRRGVFADAALCRDARCYGAASYAY